MRRARGKRKNVRRVGLRRRRPPAAGGGRLADPRGGQGRKRAALGETSSPGNSGIPAAPLFAAAGRLLMRVSTWANATTPTPARAARSEAERAEREAGQMRSCTPIFVGTRAAGIHHQVCTAPRRARRGAIANPQAPSHADPRTATLHVCAKLRPKAVFSFGPCTARFLFGQDRKENGGCIPLDKPPGGSQTPVANLRRPIPFRGVPKVNQPRWSLRPSR